MERRTAANLVTQYFFPVSHRSLESWPLPTRLVNGKAISPTVEVFKVAYLKLVAAPLIMGGRHGGAGQHIA